MTVHRMGTHDQLLGDLTLAEPIRNQSQHLPLASQQQDRSGFPGRALRRAVRRQHPSQRPDHATGIPRPREVSAPLQRNQRRARDPRSDLATEPIRDRAILTAVDNQRGGLHQRQPVANVVAIHLLKQGRCRVGTSRQPLKPREPFLLLA